jgi:hypothetical protein
MVKSADAELEYHNDLKSYWHFIIDRNSPHLNKIEAHLSHVSLNLIIHTQYVYNVQWSLKKIIRTIIIFSLI